MHFQVNILTLCSLLIQILLLFYISSQFLEVYEHTMRSDSSFLFLSAARDFGRARQIFETVVADQQGLNLIDAILWKIRFQINKVIYWSEPDMTQYYEKLG